MNTLNWYFITITVLVAIIIAISLSDSTKKIFEKNNPKLITRRTNVIILILSVKKLSSLKNWLAYLFEKTPKTNNLEYLKLLQKEQCS